MTGTPRIPRTPSDLHDGDAHCSAQDNGQEHSSVPSTDKRTLRKEMLSFRRAIDPQKKASLDKAICWQLLEIYGQTGIPDWCVFWPLPGEPDLTEAYKELVEKGIQLYLPVVLKADAPLGFAEWTPGEPMHKDAKGIAVPAKLRLIQRPEVLLIPCLAWNKDKYRLGYGGGFYDRTLAVKEPPLSIGVSYNMLEEDFTPEPHDVELDIMVTELKAW